MSSEYKRLSEESKNRTTKEIVLDTQHIYNTKTLAMSKNDRTIELKTINNNNSILNNGNSHHALNRINYVNSNSNINLSESSIKAESVIKSEKSKILNERSKISIETTNHIVSDRHVEKCESSIEQTNVTTSSSSASMIAGHHNQANNSYLSAIEASSSTFESPFSSDDLYFRNYANSGAEITRPIVSYANEMIANRALAANYEYSSVAMNSIPTSAAFDRYDMNLSNLYASTIPMQRTGITYPSYLQSVAQDDSSATQKYFHDQHLTQTSMIKTDHCNESQTPFYPRPMYHYDPSFSLTRFPAMNLALRSAASAAAAVTSSTLPIIDLSAPSVHGSNSQAYSSAQYPMIHRSNDANNTPTASPKHACTPNTSPQANSNERSIDSNLDDRLPSVSISKNRTYPLQTENSSTEQSVRRSISHSRSPQIEPVNLCNAPLKTLPFSTNNNNISIENTQNRPYSRESTSDSNASPYVDAYKADSMGKNNYCLQLIYQFVISLVFIKKSYFCFLIY